MITFLDAVQPIQVIMALIAMGALVIAIRANVGSRALFGTKLAWGFQPVHTDFPNLAKRLLAKDPIAIFTLQPANFDSQAMVQIWVENKSRRKISDIKLELTYPRSYYVDNDSIESCSIKNPHDFPELKLEIKTEKKLMEIRDAIVIGNLVRVSYNIGTLRPGESISFFEILCAPHIEKAFTDSRFNQKLFSDILNILRNSKLFLGVCHIKATLMSDLNNPTDKWVNAVAVKSNTNSDKNLCIKTFADAHWIGKKPARRLYFNPRLPWTRRNLVEKKMVVTIDTLIAKKMKSSDDSTMTVEYLDHDSTKFGVGTLGMPGYRYFDLPSGINTDEAIASEGYVLVHAAKRPSPIT